MTTSQHIKSWVEQGESETLEFKRTTGELRAAVRSLCAMLNHQGGRVIFGVEPNGRILGQQVSDRTLEEIAQEIKEIDPPVFPSVERVDWDGDQQVIVVSASPGQGCPYSYKGKPYRRVGNTSPEMSRDVYNRVLLERLHGEQRWENEPALGWSVADLDQKQIVFTLEEAIRRGRAEDPGTRDPLAILRGFGLIRDERMLRAAVVLFGRPELLEARFPQCLLRLARFKGTDKTEFLDNRQVNGNTFDLLNTASTFFREHLPVAGRVVPGLFERVDDPLYPPVALRESLANALCHRDYSIGGGSVALAIYDDRLEVTSSGTLHFGLTADGLFQPHESLPWNPLMARVLFRRGVIEAWGRGTLKIAELSERAGLPRPTIADEGGCVTVQFRHSQYVAPQRVARNLTERQQTILSLLGRHPKGLPLRTIRDTFADDPMANWRVKQDLETLQALGLIRNAGHGRGAFWFLQEGV